MKIVINRGATIPFSELPPKSIALDGYCQGPTIDPKTERYSFDHHGGCIRMITSATCKQVYDAILLGLDPKDFTVYVNDVDGDTVLAVWLLQQNPLDVIKSSYIQWLVDIVGSVDAHGPAYPLVDQEIAEQFFEGAMKPERDLQRAKKYGEADLEELLKLCCNNVTSLVRGKLDWKPSLRKIRDYRIVHEGYDGWVMVKSDENVFDLVYAKGYTKVVVYRELPDGSIKYAIGKKSDLVSGFPIGPVNLPGTILHLLNDHEPGWGGGSTIGGSPRQADGSGSKLKPKEVLKLVDAVLE